MRPKSDPAGTPGPHRHLRLLVQYGVPSDPPAEAWRQNESTATGVLPAERHHSIQPLRLSPRSCRSRRSHSHRLPAPVRAGDTGLPADTAVNSTPARLSPGRVKDCQRDFTRGWPRGRQSRTRGAIPSVNLLTRWWSTAVLAVSRANREYGWNWIRPDDPPFSGLAPRQPV